MDALDERVKVLNGRVNALADQQKAMANVRTVPTNPQTQISDPAQIQAKRDAAIQQFFRRDSRPDARPLEVNGWRPGKTTTARPTTAWAGRLAAPMAE